MRTRRKKSEEKGEGVRRVTVMKGTVTASRMKEEHAHPAAPAEEEVAVSPALDEHGWSPARPTRSAKPLSLSIAVRPTIVDVFTSPRGVPEERRNVFHVGESIQWNVVHRVSPLVNGLPYTVAVLLQRIGLGAVADEASRLEAVFPIESSLRASLKYRFVGTRVSWSFEALPPFTDSITGTRAQIVEGIAAGRFGLITHPGLWRMSAVVSIPSKVRRAYHLRSFVWDYELVPEPREDG